MALIRRADHIFTGVYTPLDDGERLIGQIYQSPKMASAHLNYLLITPETQPGALVSLLEGLIAQAGHWGTKQVIADLGSDSELFPAFRKAGFSVLAKQRVFKCESPDRDHTRLFSGWRIWRSEDIQGMRRLYNTVVPPLIQPVEPLTRREMLGLVYYDEKGGLQAYADLVYGPKGAWVLPIVHPRIEVSMTALLSQLLVDLPDRNGRPIYLAARSYQPWIEQTLENMPVKAGPEQAVMVRYLALRQRVKAEIPFAALENGNPEPTFPFTPFERH